MLKMTRWDLGTRGGVMCARVAIVLCLIPGLIRAAPAAPIKLQADDWVTECDTRHETADGDCSIIGVFRNTSTGGPKGSYSLLVDLKNGRVAVVGEPTPMRSTLRIDKFPALEWAGTPYCIFASTDAAIIRRELAIGFEILADVASNKGISRASLSTKGYNVGLAKVRAGGWPPP
jgi:hypothetical protein